MSNNPQNISNINGDKKKIIIILTTMPIFIFIVAACVLGLLFATIKLGFNVKVDAKTWFSFVINKDVLLISLVAAIAVECIIIWYLIKRNMFGFRKAISDTERADSNIHDNASLMTPREITDAYGDFSETYEITETFLDEKDKPYKMKVQAAKNDYNWNNLDNFEGIVIRSYKKHNELYVNAIKKTNVLCCGTTGTGKTQYLISPTIEANARSKTKASMIITDIKGELFARHSKMLQEQGYNTLVINLRNPQKSLRFNPLDIIYDTYHEYLDELAKGSDTALQLYSDCENYIKDFARTIIKDGEGDNADFQNGAQSLLSALIFGMLEDSSKLGIEFDESIPLTEEELNNAKNENERKMMQLKRKVAAQDNIEENNAHYGSKKIMPDAYYLKDKEKAKDNIHCEKYGYAFTKEMFTISQISNIVNKQSKRLFDFLEHRRDILTSKVSELASSIIFAKDSEKTLSSYMSTFATNMNKFLDSGIAYITSKSDFDVNDIFKKPTALFMIIPDESESRYVLASLYIRQIYAYLIKYASNHPIIEEEEFIEFEKNDSGDIILDKKGYAKIKEKKKVQVEKNKLERPVYFLCDEFANMPEIKEMAKNLSICRSRNVFFTLIVQDLNQLEMVYGDKQSKVMLGNLPMQVYLGASLPETIEYFQKMFGQYTIFQRNASINKDTIEDAFNGTTSLQTKDLVTKTELQNIKQGTVYFKELRKKPVRTVLVPHFDKELRARGFFQDGSISNDIKPDNTPIPFYDIMTREMVFNKRVEGDNNSILRLKKGTKLYRESSNEFNTPINEPKEEIVEEVETKEEIETKENKERIAKEQNQEILEKQQEEQQRYMSNDDFIEEKFDEYVPTNEVNDFVDNSFVIVDDDEETIKFDEVPNYTFEEEVSDDEEIVTDDLMAQMWDNSINNKLDIEVKVNE